MMTQMNGHAIMRTEAGIKFHKTATPRAGHGELLVAPLYAGLCGTDIQILRGDRHDPAIVIGHEGVVEIIDVGRNCPDHLVTGKKIVINPTYPNDSADFLLGHTVNGLFQEYVCMPACAVAAGLVVPFLEALPIELSPLIEPLATVMYAFELVRPERQGGAMLIYGDGTIGHLALLLAKLSFNGSLPIIFVHHRQEGLDWSIKHKIHGDIDLLFEQLPNSSDRLKNFTAPSSALIATPRTASLACLSHAVNQVAPDACIDLIGGLPDNARLASLPDVDLNSIRSANRSGTPEPAIRIKLISHDSKRLSLCGHRGVANRHLQQAMHHLAVNGRHYAKLITHQLSLQNAAMFMRHLSQHGSRQIDGERVIKLGIHINTGINTSCQILH